MTGYHTAPKSESRELTKRPREILDYIREFIAKQGYSPSVRDIAGHFSMKSPAGVHRHIGNLVEKGYLQKVDRLSRSLKLAFSEGPGEAKKEGKVAVLGHIAAGTPLETYDVASMTLPLREMDFFSRRGGAIFALRVRGVSMVDEGIEDGDYVVVEACQEAENGEIAVVLVEGMESTLKRFYLEGDRVRLQPANSSMNPMYYTADAVIIQGVVVGLWRAYGRGDS